jgi:hypothetical protein
MNRTVRSPMRSGKEAAARRSLAAALSCAGLGLVACGTGDAPSSAGTPQVTDSAGVRIVQHPTTAPGGGHAWTLGETPRTRIGAVSGAEAELLANVRHATVLSDGRIVIANGRPIEVRVFGPDGRHLTTFGRIGEGPGEFGVNGISGLRALEGDTLAIENGGRGVHFFSADGALLRSIPGPAQAGVRSSETASWLGGDSYLVSQPVPSPSGGPATTGVYAPPVNFVVWSEPTGVRTLGTFDGVVQFRPAGGPPGAPNLALPSPFNRRIAHAAGADRFHVGDQAAYEISAYTFDGRLTRIIRRGYDPVPIPQSELDAARARVREGPLFRIPAMPPAMLQHLEQQVEAMPLPESFPAFDQLMEDRAGNLWVRRLPPQEEGRRHEWEVFGADGALQATVRVPSAARILEIGHDYIVALSRGEYDVEYVHLYELSRGRPGGN